MKLYAAVALGLPAGLLLGLAAAVILAGVAALGNLRQPEQIGAFSAVLSSYTCDGSASPRAYRWTDSASFCEWIGLPI
ncbi:MAG: hypothetical protein JSW71_22975 [Gemmatimonadota bacterium]|nr:MAG: hypothetical protein JSW71_22975 [Gemmatimonadota bacterium]